jgi:hypothetical protein
MKTTSDSYKTAQLDDLKIVIREAGDPQTPAMLVLPGLKKLMKTIMTKGGTQICGSTQFWKNLSVPFYGHTRAWWPGYLTPTCKALFRRATAGCEPYRQIGWRSYTTRI